jgi:type IV secretion system protein TrbE
MPWTLREHQKEPDRLAHLLYWQRLVEDGHEDVVWQNDNSFFSVLRYRGPDMESADAHELMAGTARLHAVMMTLGEGWAVHCDERRHAAAPYPVSQWSHPVAALLDEERRAQVGTPGTHFESSYTLTLTQDIPWSLGPWWQRLWWENIPEGHAQVDKVAAFRDEIARVTDDLAGIFADVEILRGETLMTYLASTVSDHDQAVVGVPDHPWWLGSQLTDTPFVPGVTPRLGERWLRPIVVKNDHRQVGWPKTTFPGILDSLHDLPMEYRATWRWIPLSPAKANKELHLLENSYRGKHKGFWTQVREKAKKQDSGKIDQAADNDADEISEAREILDEGLVTWGYHTMTVVVWDEDFARAEAKRTQVEQVLRAQGFRASVEKIDAVGAWLGTLPGDRYNNVEKPMMTSMNFVHCMATTSVWGGPEWVPHLDGPRCLW